MFEHLKQMNAEMEALKKSYLEKSKEQFTIAAKEVFEAHPALEKFSWHQYTPYFNDGDECVFSADVDESSIGVNGEDYDSNIFREVLVDYGDYDNVTRSYPKKSETKNDLFRKDLFEARKLIAEFLGNVDESTLKDLFGDHVEVTVSRTGTEVEEYEHD